MIDKLLAELSKATVWMPTQVLVDKVGARSASNVALRLKDLEKNGSAVSRSRLEMGVKVIEWRHADKPNIGDFVPKGRGKTSPKHIPDVTKTVDAPVVRKSLTTEMPADKACCNAAAVVATTAGAEVAALNKQLAAKDEWIDAAQRKIADLENKRADLKTELDDFAKQNSVLTIELDVASRDRDSKLEESAAYKAGLDLAAAENEAWLELAQEFKCNSIPELRVFINATVDRLNLLKSENVALKTLNEAMPGFGAAYEAQKAKKPVQPRRPFSVTGLAGFHAGGDRVTLFLDRRLHAKSITLPADKLHQLAEMARAA